MNTTKNSLHSRQRVYLRGSFPISQKRAANAENNYTKIGSNGKIYGEVRGDVFVKELLHSKHFFRKHSAYCSERISLHDAQAAGAHWACNIERDTGQVYWVPIATIFEKGFVPPENQNQIGLHIKYWHCGARPPAEQLNLWEGEDV